MYWICGEQCVQAGVRSTRAYMTQHLCFQSWHTWLMSILRQVDMQVDTVIPTTTAATRVLREQGHPACQQSSQIHCQHTTATCSNSTWSNNMVGGMEECGVFFCSRFVFFFPVECDCPMLLCMVLPSYKCMCVNKWMYANVLPCCNTCCIPSSSSFCIKVQQS